jgi:transcriptional regulator
MHTNKSKVSLIEKKSYERMHTLQENNSLLANTTQITLSFADKAIVLVQDCLTTLGESSQKITHKLKKVIAYIREMQSEQSK